LDTLFKLKITQSRVKGAMGASGAGATASRPVVPTGEEDSNRIGEGGGGRLSVPPGG